jgi:uncharacterized protein (TIGR00730 family)
MGNTVDLMHNIQSICVFAGTTSGKNNNFIEQAKEIGTFIGINNFKLVYGGGSTGIMGAVAKSALEVGGYVIGVLPECMSGREDTLREANELLFEKSMHQRKQKMYDLADAFLALPGGIGTLDETIEVLTWINLDIHSKPLFLFDIDGYWNPLLRLIDHMIEQGFLHTKIHNHLVHINNPQEILLLEKKTDKPTNILQAKQIEYLIPYDKAYVLQELAATVGFDWKNVRDALDKIEEEKRELSEEIMINNNQLKITEEYGDLLFAVINLARHLKIDHKEAINMTCDKFIKRFTKLEEYMALSPRKLPLEEMLEFWGKAKKSD